MASPVELSDLPVAPSADNSDVTLLRKGLTDYQCAVQLIRNINVGALSPLPNGVAEATDLLLISRNISGTPQNFQIQFSQVSFPTGTRLWFWNGLPVYPTWSVVPNTGDRLLAVADFSTGYSGAGGAQQSGSWQQNNATLSIDQIPAHNHFAPMDNSNDSGSSTTLFSAGKTFHSPFRNNRTFTTGGSGSSTFASNPSSPDYSLPGTNGHNHGNAWRPLANVGIICNKDS